MGPGTEINKSWKRHLPEPSDSRPRPIHISLHRDLQSIIRTCPALVSWAKPKTDSLFVAPTGKHMTDFDAPLSAKVTACPFIMSRISEVRLAPRERSGPQSGTGTSALWHPCVPIVVYKPSVAGPAYASFAQLQVSLHAVRGRCVEFSSCDPADYFY